MADKYNIMELIPTHSRDEVSAKLKFGGTVVYLKSVGEALTNGLDAVMNAKLACGATIFQTINNHWHLSVRHQTVRPFASLVLISS